MTKKMPPSLKAILFILIIFFVGLILSWFLNNPNEIGKYIGRIFFPIFVFIFGFLLVRKSTQSSKS